MMPDISYFPLSIFIICFPKNKPTKEIEKVNTRIMETCNHAVTFVDKPACIVTPAARASTDVFNYSSSKI